MKLLKFSKVGKVKNRLRKCRFSSILEVGTEGKASEIVEMGIDFGLSENAILDRLQKKLNISSETAQEYLEKFGKQTV